MRASWIGGLAALALLATASPAQAGPTKDVQVRESSSLPGATDVVYTIAWQPNGTGADHIGNAIHITFPAGWNLASLDTTPAHWGLSTGATAAITAVGVAGQTVNLTTTASGNTAGVAFEGQGGFVIVYFPGPMQTGLGAQQAASTAGLPVSNFGITNPGTLSSGQVTVTTQIDSVNTDGSGGIATAQLTSNWSAPSIKGVSYKVSWAQPNTRPGTSAGIPSNNANVELQFTFPVATAGGANAPVPASPAAFAIDNTANQFTTGSHWWLTSSLGFGQGFANIGGFPSPNPSTTGAANTALLVLLNSGAAPVVPPGGTATIFLPPTPVADGLGGGVNNPSTTGTYYFRFRTVDDALRAGNPPFGACDFTLPINIAVGTLAGIVVSPGSNVVGANTVYNVAFTADNPIPANGHITLTFPVGTSLATITQPDISVSAPAGFSLSSVSVSGPTNNVLDIVCGGTQTSPGNFAIQVGSAATGHLVTNPTTIGTATLTVATRDATPSNVETGTSPAYPNGGFIGADLTSLSGGAPTVLTTSSNSNWTFNFTSPSTIRAGDLIALVFPADTNLSSVVGGDVAVTPGSGPAFTVGTVTATGQTLTIQNGAAATNAGSYVVTISNNHVKNPTIAGTLNAAAKITTGGGTNIDPAGAGTTDPFPSFTLAGGALSPFSIAPLSTTTSSTPAQYSFTFTLRSQLPAGGQVNVSFPAGTSVAGSYTVGTDVTATGFSIGTATGLGQTVTLTNGGAAVAAGTAVTVTFSAGGKIVNPATVGGGYTVAVNTATSSGTVIDSATSAAYSITKNQIGTITVAPTSSQPGVSSTYTVSFQTRSTLPANGKVEIRFKKVGDATGTGASSATFSFTGVAVSSWAGVDDSPYAPIDASQAAAQILTFPRTGSGTASRPQVMHLTFTPVGNAPAGSYYVDVRTLDATNAVLDDFNNDSGTPFSLTPNAFGAISVTPNSTVANAGAVSYVVSLVLPGGVTGMQTGGSTTDVLEIDFPAGVDISGARIGATSIPAVGPKGADNVFGGANFATSLGYFTNSAAGGAGTPTNFRLSRDVSGTPQKLYMQSDGSGSAGGIPGNTTISISFSNVTNPPPGSYQVTASMFHTTAPAGDTLAGPAFAGPSSSSSFTILDTVLQSLTVQSILPNAQTTTANVAYRTTFTTRQTIPNNGTITLDWGLPQGFNIPATPAFTVIAGGTDISAQFTISSTFPSTFVTLKYGTFGGIPPTGMVVVIGNAGVNGVINTSTAGTYGLNVTTRNGPGSTLEQGTANFQITGGPLTAISDALSPNSIANRLVTHTVSFTTRSTLANNGQAVIQLPAGFDLTNVQATDVTWTAPGGITIAGVTTTGKTMLTVPRNAAGALIGSSTVCTIQINNVVNTPVVGNYTVTVTTEDNLGNAIDGPTAGGAIAIVGAALTGVVDAPGPSRAGETATHTVTFTTNSSLPANGSVVVTFPTLPDTFNLSNVPLTPGSFSWIGIDGTFTVGKTPTALTFTRNNDGTTTGPGNFSITIPSVVNAATPGASAYTITVATQNPGPSAIDGPTTSAAFSVTQGALTAVLDGATGSSLNSGFVGAQHIVTFNTNSSLPKNGRVVIVFPGGYDLSLVNAAAVVWTVNGSGVAPFTAVPAGQTLTLTNTTAGPLNAGSYSIAISKVTNTTTTGAQHLTVKLVAPTGTDETATANTADFTIGTSALSPVTHAPQTSTAGATIAHTVTFTTTSIVPTSGLVDVIFPVGFTVPFGSATITPAIGGSFSSPSANVLRFTATALVSTGTFTIRDTAVINSTVIQTYNVQVQTLTAAAAVIQGPTADSPADQIVGGAINTISIAPGSVTAGTTTPVYTLGYKTVSQFPINATLAISVAGFDFTGATVANWIGPSGAVDGTITPTIAGSTITVQRVGGSAPIDPGSWSIQINNVKNSTVTGNHAISVQTQTNSGTVLDPAGSITLVVNGSPLGGPGAGNTPQVSPSPTTAGATGASHTVTFATLSTLPKNGKVVITYNNAQPDTFFFTPVANVPNAPGYSWIGVNGGFFVTTTAGGVVTLVRDNTGNDTGPGTMAIVVPVSQNAATPTSYTVSIVTETNGGAVIDGTAIPGTTSAAFALGLGSVTNVSDSPSSTGAGATSVTHTIGFTTNAAIPPSGRVRITFDTADYDLSQVTTASVSGIAASAVSTSGNQVIDITGPVGASVAPGNFTIAIANIGNTPTTGSHTTQVAQLTPLATTNVAETSAGTSAPFTITTLSITNFDPPALGSSVANAFGVAYTASFTTNAAIPTNGFVDIQLPADESIWQVTSTAAAAVTAFVVTTPNLANDTDPSRIAYLTVAPSGGNVTVSVFSDAARTVLVSQGVAPINPLGTTVTLARQGGGTLDGTLFVPYVTATTNLTATLSGFTWTHGGVVSASRTAILAGNIVRLQNTGPSLSSGVSNVITLLAVANSSVPGTKSMSVRTVKSDGTTILEAAATRTFAIAGTALGGPASQPQVGPDPLLLNSDKTLVKSRYVVRFSTESTIPSGGRLELTFPAGFTISAPTAVAWTYQARGNPNDSYPAVDPTASIGAVTNSISAQTIALVVPVALAPGHHEIVLDGIQNSAVPGSYAATLKTRDTSFVALDPPGVATTLSAAWTINGQTLAAPTVQLQPATSGAVSNHTIQFTTASQIPSNGRLVITYSNKDSLASGRFGLGTIAVSSVTWAGIDGTFTVTLGANTVTLTRNADGQPASPAAQSVTLVGVTNASRVESPPPPVPSDAYNLALQTQFASGAAIDSSSATTLSLTSGAVSGVVLNSPTTTTSNAVVSYDLSFTTQSILPRLAKIQITFPPGTALGGVSVTQNTIPGGGTLGVATLAAAANVLTVENDGPSDIAPGAWRLIANGVTNTPAVGSYKINVLTTQAAGTIDAGANSNVLTVAGGFLNGATVTNGSSTVGVTTSYTLKFQATSQVPSGGRFEATFPSGFGIPASPAVTWQTTGAGNPTVSVNVVGQTVQVTNTSGAIAPTLAGTQTITIGGIANTTSAHVPQTTYTLPIVRTTDASGTVIDATANFGSFQIVPAGLSNLTNTPAPSGANQPQTTHTVTFQQSTTLPKDGIVTLVFPPSFTIAAVPSVTWAGINGGFTVNVNVGTATITLARDGSGADTSPTTHSIAILGITNSGTVAATHSVSVTPRDVGNGPIETTAFTQAFSIANTPFTNVTDSPNPATTSNTSIHTIGFTTVAVIRPGNVLDLRLLDVNFSFASVTTASINWTSPSGPVSGNTFSIVEPSQNLLRITFNGAAPIASGTHSIVISNVFNTSTVGNATITPTLWLSNPVGGNPIAGPTASPPFAIAGAALASVQVQPFSGSDVANTASVAYTFRFSSFAPVPAGGQVLIRFQKLGVTDPFQFNTTTPTAPILIGWTVNGAPVSVLSVTEPDNQSILLTRDLTGGNISGANVIQIYQMGRNHPTAASNHTVQVTTRNVSGLTIEGPTSSQAFTLKGGSVTAVGLALASNTSGAASNETISFTTNSSFPVDGQLVVSYDPNQPPAFAHWTVPGALGAACGLGTFSSVTFNPATQTLTLQRDGTGAPTIPGAYTLTVNGFVNSTRQHVGTSHVVRVTTLNGGGATIDSPGNSPAFALAAGQIAVATYTLTPSFANASAAHVATFTTVSNIASDARFVVTTSDPKFNFATTTSPTLLSSAGSESLGIESAVGNKIILVRKVGAVELLPGTVQLVLQTVTNSSASTGGASSDTSTISMNLGPQFGPSPSAAVDNAGTSPGYQVTGGPVVFAKFTLTAAYQNRQIFPAVSTLQLFDASNNPSVNTQSNAISIVVSSAPAGPPAGGGSIIAGGSIPIASFNPITATVDLHIVGVTYAGNAGVVVLRAQDGLTALVTSGSSTITIQPGPLQQLQWVTTSSQLVGKAFTPSVRANALDQDGNVGAQLPVQGVRFVSPTGTISGLPGPGGNVTSAFPGGVATLDGVAVYTGTIPGSGVVTITGEVANGPPGTPITNVGNNQIIMNPGDAVQARWTGISGTPQKVDAPIADNVTVSMLDAGGNPTGRVGGFVRFRATTGAADQAGYTTHRLSVVNNPSGAAAPPYAGGDPDILYFDLSPNEFNGGALGQVTLQNRLVFGGFVSPPTVTFTTEPVSAVAQIASTAKAGTSAAQLVDGAGTFAGVAVGSVVLDLTNGARAVVLSVNGTNDTITFETPGPTGGLAFAPGHFYEVHVANPAFPTVDVGTGQPPKIPFFAGRVSALDFQSSMPATLVVGQPFTGGALAARDRFGNLTNDVAPSISLTLAAVPGYAPADMAVAILSSAIFLPADFSGVTTGVAPLTKVVYNGKSGAVTLGGRVSGTVADIATNSNAFITVPGAPAWAEWVQFGPVSPPPFGVPQQNNANFSVATPSARVLVYDVGGNPTDDTGPGRPGYTLGLALDAASPDGTAAPVASNVCTGTGTNTGVGVRGIGGIRFTGQTGLMLLKAQAGGGDLKNRTTQNSSVRTIQVTPGPIDHFQWNLDPVAPQKPGFALTGSTYQLRAKDVSDNLIIDFATQPGSIDPTVGFQVTPPGSPTLAIPGSPPALNTTVAAEGPGLTVIFGRTSFVQGISDISSLVYTGVTGAILLKTTGAPGADQTSFGAVNPSNKISYVSGPLDHFDFSTGWTAQSQANDARWASAQPLTMTAKDAGKNPVTDPTQYLNTSIFAYQLKVASHSVATVVGGLTITDTAGTNFSAIATIGDKVLDATAGNAIGVITNVNGTQLTVNTLALGTRAVFQPGDNFDIMGKTGQILTKNKFGSVPHSNLVESQTGEHFNTATAVMDIQGPNFAGALPNGGFRYQGVIPPSGKVRIIPASSGGADVRVTVGDVPAVIDVTIVPGALASFGWQIASTQQDAVAFTGSLTLTALDVSTNVITGYAGSGANVAVNAAAGKSSQVRTGAATSTDPTNPNTTLHDTSGGFNTLDLASQPLYVHDLTTGTTAKVISVPNAQTIVTLPVTGYSSGDRYIVDAAPVLPAITFTSGAVGNVLNATSFVNGVANVSAQNPNATGLTYRGLATGQPVSLIAAASSVTLNSGAAFNVVMNPGAPAALETYFTSVQPVAGGFTPEQLVQGDPGAITSRIAGYVDPQPSGTTRGITLKVSVVDVDDNVVFGQAGSVALADSDPNAQQPGTSPLANGTATFVLTGATAPRTVFTSPWTLTATLLALPASTRRVLVQTDGVQRLAYLFPRDVATGTASVTSTTALTDNTANFVTLGVQPGWVVVDQSDANATSASSFAYGIITAVAPTQLTVGAGFTGGALDSMNAGHTYLVTPQYHLDGQVDLLGAQRAGVAGVQERLVAGISRPRGLQVLTLDSGENRVGPVGSVTVRTDDQHDGIAGISPAGAGQTLPFVVGSGQVAIAPYVPKTAAASPIVPATALPKHAITVTPTFAAPAISDFFEVIPGAAAQTLVVLPGQSLDAGAALLGAPVDQTANVPFTATVAITDAVFNTVNVAATVSLTLSAAANGSITPGVSVTQGTATVPSILCRTAQPAATGWVVTPSNGVGTQVVSSRIEVLPGSAAQTIVLIRGPIASANSQTLAPGQTLLANAVVTTPPGPLRAIAGNGNVPIQIVVADSVFNPVLVNAMSPAARAAAKTLRVNTTDPINPQFLGIDCTAGPAFGTLGPTAVGNFSVSLTRAQLQHTMVVDTVSAQPVLIAGAQIDNVSSPIRIDPGAATQAIVLLPGEKLTSGTSTLAAAVGTPQGQQPFSAVQSIPFTALLLAVDNFFNIDWNNNSAINSVQTDDGNPHAGRLGQSISAENAPTSITGGQIHVNDLNGKDLGVQVFGSGTTGTDIANAIRARIQLLKIDQSTNLFDARFFQEFQRYVLLNGMSATLLPVPANSTLAVHSVDTGSPTTGVSLLMGSAFVGPNGSAEAPGRQNGVSLIPSPGNPDNFSNGVAAFRIVENNLGRHTTVPGTALATNNASDGYQVSPPTFNVLSVTAESDGTGSISKARVVFSLPVDLATAQAAGPSFQLKLVNAGVALATLTGTGTSVLSTVAANDTLEISMDGSIFGTSSQGLVLTYTQPTAAPLQADASVGGRLLASTSIPTDPPGKITDGAPPVLLSVTPYDLDGNGGMERVTFTWSEPIQMLSAHGVSRSGFGAGQKVRAGNSVSLSLDGDVAMVVTFTTDQTGGANVANVIRTVVRATNPVNQLKKRAYGAFDCTFDSANGRYILRSGTSVAWNGTSYVLQHGSSSVVVAPIGSADVSAALLLGVANAGVEKVGRGNGQVGQSVGVAGVISATSLQAGVNDQLAVNLNGEGVRTIALGPIAGASVADFGSRVAAAIQLQVRQLRAINPAFQRSYDDFVSFYDPANARIVLLSGTEGTGSTVQVVSKVLGTTDASPLLGLGTGNGGTELPGANNTVLSIDGLILLRNDGQKDLLAGLGGSALQIGGSTLTVNLANDPANGTANPRFAWLDDGSGALLADLAIVPNAIVPPVTDVPQIGAGALGVVNNGVGTYSPGDITLDASQSLPPLQGTSGFVTYSWSQPNPSQDPAAVTIQNANLPVAKALALLKPGTYTFQLTLSLVDATGKPIVNAFTDGQGRIVRTFTVTVTSDPPIAVPGPDRIVTGPTVLDGSKSMDPNGGALTYLWTAQDATGVPLLASTFNDPTLVKPTFTAPTVGTFTVTLWVAKAPNVPIPDPIKTPVPSHASLLVTLASGTAVPPSADAGLDQVTRVSTLVTLDGSSSAATSGALQYSWTVVSSPAPVAFSNPAVAQPTFVPSTPGLYTFQLVVTDSLGVRSAPRTVDVTAIDDRSTPPRVPPVARPRALGLQSAAFVSATVSLAKAPTSVTFDDGTTQTFAVFDLASASTRPTAAQIAGLVPVQVYSGSTLFGTGYVQAPAGASPASIALADRSTVPVSSFARAGDAVVFDATRSQSASNVIQAASWTQASGPFLFSTRQGNVFSSVVPAAGTYDFDLVVTDSTNLVSRPRRLRVFVLPTGATGQGPPTAIIAAPKPPTATVGTGISVSAKGSVIRTTGAATFSWTQTGGPLVGLTGSTTDTLGFTPSVAGLYSFEVRVTDTNGVSDTADITVAAAGSPGAPTVTPGNVPAAVLDPKTRAVTVRLSASGTSPSGSPLTFFWSQTDGSPVFVDTSSSSSSPSLHVTAPGHYAFLVQASDGKSKSSPQLVEFDVSGGQDQAISQGLGVQTKTTGGCEVVPMGTPIGEWAWALLVLGLVVLRRRER